MPNEVTLAKIADSLSAAVVALQVSAKIVVPEFNATGDLIMRTVTEEEWRISQSITPASPTTPKLIPVEPSVRRDGSTPFVWVFTCPPPYNGVEIVCVPDATTYVGICCTASAPNMSRERDKFQVAFAPLEKYLVEMDKEEYTDYREWVDQMELER